MTQFNKKYFPALGSLAKPKKVVEQKTELTDEIKAIVELYQKEMMTKFVGQKIDVDWDGDIPIIASVPVKPHIPEVTITPAPNTVTSKELKEFLKAAFDKNPCSEVTVGYHEVMKLIPPPEEKMGLTLSTVKKTKPKKPKGKKQGPKPTEIFQWQMHSKKEVAGVKATYTTVLRSDGSIACNCPGWIFKKKGQSDRSCKHTSLIEDEALGLFKKWKKGEKLGEVVVEITKVSNAPSHSPALPSTKYGRVIDIE